MVTRKTAIDSSQGWLVFSSAETGFFSYSASVLFQRQGESRTIAENDSISQIAYCGKYSRLGGHHYRSTSTIDIGQDVGIKD